MKTFRSLTSAMRAFNRFANAYRYHTRRLHNIAKRDACKGDLFIGWDMPTLRMVRPADYALLIDITRKLNEARAWVLYYSPMALEYAV